MYMGFLMMLIYMYSTIHHFWHKDCDISQQICQPKTVLTVRLTTHV